MFANSVGKQKSVVCSESWPTFYCWPTLLAVYELVRFLLANKRQTVRCDWLAVEWRQNGRMHLVLTTLTFALSMIAPKQISGAYVFA